ncbi:MAG: hypothetical protein GY953_21935, partial [bacterium]|nr:hypothetical protein [bacterium]
MTGLLALPAIWWLLRFTPPRPKQIVFPPTRLLRGLEDAEHMPAHSPWWLTAIRMALAAFVILALARPVLNPEKEPLPGTGPLVLIVDNGWTAATDWELRKSLLESLIDRAERNGRAVILVPTAQRARAPDLRAR